MRNKLLMLGLVFTLVFSLAMFAACGGNGDDEPVDQGPVIEEQPPAVPDPDPPAPPVEPDPPADDNGDDVVDPEPEVAMPDPIPRPAGVVYSLATDAWIQHLDVGTMGVGNVLDPTPYLTEAGGPTWTVVEGPGGANALQLTNRMETWNALDLQIPELGLDLDNYTYMVTVTGTIAWGGVGQLGGADSPWGTFATAETDDDNNFTVSLLLDAAQVEELGERNWLRIASQCTNNLTINSISVVAQLPRPANVLWSMSTDAQIQWLDVGTMGVANVLATPMLTEAGGPTWTIVEGPYGNAVQLTNRMETWNALDLVTPNLGMDLANNTYTLTVRGNVAWGGVGQIGGADSPWGTFATADTDDDNNFEVSLLLDEAQVEGAGERRWIRLASQCTNNLVIHEVSVVRN